MNAYRAEHYLEQYACTDPQNELVLTFENAMKAVDEARRDALLYWAKRKDMPVEQVLIELGLKS